ncbi:hypothetical protein H0H92_009165 [Tricholoma furcatifolium]|nr:hypothetical protein H0H92_009165 [Tricholoma furcatifolium]
MKDVETIKDRSVGKEHSSSRAMNIFSSSKGAFLALLGIAISLGTQAIPQTSSPPFAFRDTTFINSTGLTTEVGWDPYSFFVQGKRIFLQSGEFHTWRLPVPGLWNDIVQKAKAAGLNSISIYLHWHLINPKSGEIDLSGINDLQPFFDAAKEAGLFVIARPGPYINSETSNGGIPGHVTTIPGNPSWNLYNGEMRSNDTYFHAAWQDYWNAVIPVIAENQVTNGGPVIMVQIENEYYNGAGQNEYVAELRQRALELGIVVPTDVNDPGEYQNLVDSANIYGIDAYPNSLNCASPETWRTVPTTWRSYHEEVTPEIPFMFPEFQGGANDNWGSVGGYAACRELTNPKVEPTGVKFRSQDYGAAVGENRNLTSKFDELKLQSLFLRSFADLRKTDWQGDDNTTVSGVTTTHLQNPDTGSSFYITRHTDTTVSTSLTLQLTVGAANITVPQLGGNATLLGRDSFITSTDLAFGSSSKLLYSTAMLFTTIQLGGDDALFVYGNAGLVYEVAVEVDEAPSVLSAGATQVTTEYIQNQKAVVINFTVASGLTTVKLGAGQKTIVILIADYPTATNLWMPTIAGEGEFANYVDIAASAPLVVRGPYLVRTATLSNNALALTGDLNQTTTLTLYGPSTLSSLTWNGNPVNAKNIAGGTWQATLTIENVQIEIPDLMSARWTYADSLPERSPDWDDSALILADHTTTTSVFPPYYGGPWILYADDYGFHAGNLLWRGTFVNNASLPAPTAVNLSISGGQNFAASAWLNGNFLGSSDTREPTNNETWPVTSDMLIEGVNYVIVLQDNMGGNLAGQIVCCTPGGRQRDLQQPRGIQGYYLEGRPETAQFTGWKMTGNYMGENFPDKTRKILNEGGLYAERMGWHLPGFDDSQWEFRTPFQGLSEPGVGFFRTTFTLNLPKGYDIPLAVVFDSAEGWYRSQLYINGWQMGKRVANIGPQTSFVVQQGIFDYQGENTVAVSFWSLGSNATDLALPSLRIVEAAIIESGTTDGVVYDNPDWQQLRG